jgi:flagellar motor switch protein FliN
MADENQVPQSAGTEAAPNEFRLPASSAEPDTGNSGPSADSGGMDPAAMESLAGGSNPGSGASSSAPPSADADKLLAQNDIDMLLKQAGLGSMASSPTPAAAPTAVRPPPPSPKRKEPARTPTAEGELAQGDLDLLFSQAQRALASIDAVDPHSAPPPGATPFHLEQFAGAPASTEMATLDLVRDVELDLRIELGRTNMYLEDVLRLRRGSVVPLDKMAGDPVDVFVNGRLIARGEVLVLNDNFCVRVAELVSGTGPPA